MNPVVYDFNNVCLKKFTNYICQFISKRKLTDVYHSHVFYEVVIVLSGNGRQIVNGNLLTFAKDSLIIFRPGDFHSFKTQSEDTSVISLSVSREEFVAFAEAYEKGLTDKIDKHPNPITVSYPNAASDLAVKCNKIFSDCNEYECKFLLSLVLKRYIDYTNKNENDIPQELFFALNEIKKPENLKLGIPVFIHLSNYSRTHLSRLMKKYLNTTIHEYITNIKLEYAYSRLIFTDVSIAEICEDTGYLSISHFNKIFKEKFKITPAMLRKKHGIRTV